MPTKINPNTPCTVNLKDEKLISCGEILTSNCISGPVSTYFTKVDLRCAPVNILTIAYFGLNMVCQRCKRINWALVNNKISQASS